MICIPTRNPNKWLVPILETTIIVMDSISINRRVSLRTNAVIFQNQGNCNVVLSNGFTLEPGQSFQFGNYNELNTLIVDIMVQFLPATATTDPVVQLLEIVQIMTKLTNSGYYIDQNEINPVTPM